MTVFPAVRFHRNDADCSAYHLMTGDRPKAPSAGGSTSEHHPKRQLRLTNNSAQKSLHLSDCWAGLTGWTTAGKGQRRWMDAISKFLQGEHLSPQVPYLFPWEPARY